MTRVDVFDQFQWEAVPFSYYLESENGPVGAINNCTFKFWRNHWLPTWELLFGKSMRTIYNECSGYSDFDITTTLEELDEQ